MSLFPSDSAPDWIHAHCDGGARGNPGPAGFGAVITDSHGRTLAELSEFLGIRTNNFAEYSGLLAVLAWALQHGHPRLKVVSDSELMVSRSRAATRSTHPTSNPSGRPPATASPSSTPSKSPTPSATKTRKPTPSPTPPWTVAKAVNLTPQRSSPCRSAPNQPPPPNAPAMLRGFTKDGSIHLLGSATLPDGIFVKIIRE